MGTLKVHLPPDTPYLTIFRRLVAKRLVFVAQTVDLFAKRLVFVLEVLYLVAEAVDVPLEGLNHLLEP